MPSAGALRAGRAVIELGLDSDGVTSGLDKLQGQMRRFGKTLQNIGKQAAIAGAAITAPFVLAVRKFTDLGSELQDASVRTGVSVEALSALKFAAEQSGASFENLEKGIRFLQKSGGDASVAGIMRIADELASISDPSERARRSMELFGRFAGPELLPLLSAGSNGLRMLMEQAEATGNVMSTQTAVAAEQLGDAFDVVKTQLATLLVNIATAISGDLQAFTDKIIEITTGLIQWIKEHQNLIRIVAFTGAALTAFGLVTHGLGLTFIGLSKAIKFARLSLIALSKHPWLAAGTLATIAVGEMTGLFDELGRKIDEVIGISDEAAQVAKLTDEFDRLRVEAEDASEAMEKVEDFELPDIPALDLGRELDRKLNLSTRFQPALDSAADVSRSASRTESLFDTRLAKQVFGKQSDRIEEEQLRVQRRIEQNTRPQPNQGIPVVP